MTTPTNPSNQLGKGPSRDVLLGKVREEIEANLNNEQFSVEYLAERMNMSRSHLHRKLKKDYQTCKRIKRPSYT